MSPRQESTPVAAPHKAAASPSEVLPELPSEEEQMPEDDDQPDLVRLNAPSFIAELPTDQYRALIEICAGRGVLAAASAASVSRATLYRWQKYDARFIAAVNLWRQQTRTRLDTGMSALVDDALETLADAVKTGNVRAALAVIRHVGAGRPGSASRDCIAERLNFRKKRLADRMKQMRAQPEQAGPPS